MTSAKKKQQNHENVPFSQGKTMWKAQQAKEKSGAARKREAYIFFCAAARRQPQKVRQRRQERAQMVKNLKFHNLAKIHISLRTKGFDAHLKI